MIGRDQLVLPVIWLSPVHDPLAIVCPRRQLVRPVHPINAGIDVVLIAGADLEDSGDPVIVRLFGGLSRLAGVLLSFDGRVIGDKDEALAEVLDAVYCGACLACASAKTQRGVS